jgi:hypothetical protein
MFPNRAHVQQNKIVGVADKPSPQPITREKLLWNLIDRVAFRTRHQCPHDFRGYGFG